MNITEPRRRLLRRQAGCRSPMPFCKATLLFGDRRDRIARVAPGQCGRAPSDVDAGPGQRTGPAGAFARAAAVAAALSSRYPSTSTSPLEAVSVPQPALESTAIAPAPPRLHTAARTAVTPAANRDVDTNPASWRLSLPNISWPYALLTVWAVGAGLVLLRLATGLLGVLWLSRRTEHVTEASWLPLARSLAAELGVSPRLVFLRSRHAAMPMAWGILRPSVLMPADADTWPAERLRIVLLHELAHVKRRDCLTHMLAQISCALYWFNPLAWMAARHLRTERERACDDLVLAAGTRGPGLCRPAARDCARHALGPLPGVVRRREPRDGAALAARGPPHGDPRSDGSALGSVPPENGCGNAAVRLRGDAARRGAAVDGGRRSARDGFRRGDGRRHDPASRWRDAAGPDAADPAKSADRGGAAHDTCAAAAGAGAAGSFCCCAASPRSQIRRSRRCGRASSRRYPRSSRRCSRPSRPDVHPHVAADVRIDQDHENDKARKADPRTIAALTAALKDTDKDVRETALQALVQLRDPGIFEPLVQALADAAADVREHAAFGLGQMRDKRGVEPLTRALKDQNGDVREQAAFALGQIRDRSAVAALTAAIKDSVDDVREQVVFALGQLRDPAAVDALAVAAARREADVRQQAVFALGQIRDPRAVEPLISALKDADADVREQAAFALGQTPRSPARSRR